jgi:RNA polymerase sigma-70 factor (ECF subfamily)
MLCQSLGNVIRQSTGPANARQFYNIRILFEYSALNLHHRGAWTGGGSYMENDAVAGQPALERYRSYLLLIAGLQLEGPARKRIDPSDIVQQTLLEAHARMPQFRGDESALAGWLRQALVNNLRDAWRALKRDKRDVRRELALDAGMANSSARLEAFLAAAQSSPSQQAVRNEDLLRLADALAQLPEPQRQAIVLHHLHCCSLTETARQLQRSDAAVAGLLHRGLKTLRRLMDPGERS